MGNRPCTSYAPMRLLRRLCSGLLPPSNFMTEFIHTHVFLSGSQLRTRLLVMVFISASVVGRGSVALCVRHPSGGSGMGCWGCGRARARSAVSEGLPTARDSIAFGDRPEK